MTHKLRFGFCGSGRFAAECLSLITAGKAVPDWVVTNSPRPSGRGLRLQNTPVFETASELGISVTVTDKFSADENAAEMIRRNAPDLILVIDFGHMIREPILSMTPLGCINMHPSMLPAYRGSAPIQRAIMDGLKETGVTLFRLDKGMDSGPVLAQIPITIDDTDDSLTLLSKACCAGSGKLLEYLLEISPEKWCFTAQPEKGVSFAPKIEKSEGKIDWGNTSTSISNRIRALAAAPGTYCEAAGRRLRINKAAPTSGNGAPGELISTDKGFPVIACGEGALILTMVQPEGKSRKNADEWLRGSRIKLGDILN